MQHLVQNVAPGTKEENLILELSSLFDEHSLPALFDRAFLWYFSPHKMMRAEIVENAQSAYVTYEEYARVPEFFNRIPLLYARIRALEDAPVGGRHNPIRTESDMQHALMKAAEETRMHTCTPYDRRHCPCFWRTVFHAYYGTNPVGSTDSRYDTLFVVGMPAYQKLFP